MSEKDRDGDGDGDTETDTDTETEEKLGLRRVFEEISDEFTETRQRPWDEVVGFVDGVEGDLCIDLGCGNGRHIETASGSFETVVGVDFSRRLLERARDKGEVVEGDVSRLPVRDGVADAFVYVAALHHLPSHDERLRSLNEAERVLRDGGEGLISVWAIEHPKFDGARDEIRAKNHDIYVPWKSETGEEYDRYYHIYTRDGFESVLKESNLEVGDVWLSSGNYYATTRA
ncbi:MAG: class I SAM-dependent methyltransferase [Halobacteria archaeon]|nr:class I SAM-dependent methyltransferase [Halobacteria archaeon]